MTEPAPSLLQLQSFGRVLAAVTVTVAEPALQYLPLLFILA
jgi:hypothetical protein